MANQRNVKSFVVACTVVGVLIGMIFGWFVSFITQQQQQQQNTDYPQPHPSVDLNNRTYGLHVYVNRGCEKQIPEYAIGMNQGVCVDLTPPPPPPLLVLEFDILCRRAGNIAEPHRQD
ncbi:hypothetical protein O3P69_005786 [Scylla paramamosain]|uniref:Transmembrane protein n=1 Tax=Scylla paramamosain TaxID=85552 RepID=A0AAW0UAP4_SCYPA